MSEQHEDYVLGENVTNVAGVPKEQRGVVFPVRLATDEAARWIQLADALGWPPVELIRRVMHDYAGQRTFATPGIVVEMRV